MSSTTVPKFTASGSESFVDEAGIRLRVYRDLGETSVPAADVHLTEDRAAEVIADLAIALQGTAPYGPLATLILDHFAGAGNETTAAAGTPRPAAAVPTAGCLVAVIRDGKPVFAEGYAAHADTSTEAARVAAAWQEIGERVRVFELVEVAA